jgi:ABC-2 type transport system permease protein
MPRLSNQKTVEESPQDRAARVEELPFLVFGKRESFLASFMADWKSVLDHFPLLAKLVGRELKAKYKDSFFGIVWSLAKPLVQLLIYYFAIGQVLGASRSVPNFAIFVFVGLSVWALYTEIIYGSTSSIIANEGLVKKVYLPREIFPFSAVGTALVNSSFQGIVLLGGIFLFSSLPAWPNVAIVPIALLGIIVFATGIGLILAALNVYFRDTQQFVDLYVMVFFWLSPIVYPFAFVKGHIGGTIWESLYLSNPATIFVLAMQKGLWNPGETGASTASSVPSDLDLRVWVCLGFSLLLLLVAQRIFAKLRKNFAQEL